MEIPLYPRRTGCVDDVPGSLLVEPFERYVSGRKFADYTDQIYDDIASFKVICKGFIPGDIPVDLLYPRFRFHHACV